MIRIVGPRVLVALPPNTERTTDSGIILARDPELRAHTQGIVMALGEKSGTVDMDEVLSIIDALETRPAWHARDDAQMCRDEGPLMVGLDSARAALKMLGPAPFDVAVGDMVLFPASAGELFEQDGIRYLILPELDIIGVVEQKEAA